jgi:hypothetical protein
LSDRRISVRFTEMRRGFIGVVALGACLLGGCGEDEQSAEENAVRSALTKALTASDSSACSELYTQRLLEQSEARRGRAALRECRDDFERAAKKAEIENVSVSGPRAAADVRPTGGTLTFEKMRVGLRRAGGRWRLDRLKSATLDREAFLATTRKEITSPPDAQSPAVADCVERELKQASDTQIVRAFIAPDVRPLLIPAVVCAVRVGLDETGAPRAISACVARRMRRELTTGRTGRRMQDDPGDIGFLLDSSLPQQLGRETAERCIKR